MEMDRLYRSHNIARLIGFRRLRFTGHVARIEACRSVFKILTVKLTGKIPLERPRLKWMDNIGMDL